jgi:cyclopropane-fatty-acyl-phospholipid synthase
VRGGGGPDSPVLEIRDQDAFFRRVGGGTAGFAESYMAGEWDSGDLVGLFTVLATHLPTLVPGPLRALRRWYVPPEPTAEDATIEGARRNIQRHYDLSNEFFALFLDPTLTYSSALFGPGDTLTDAQRRKNQALLDLTGVRPGSTVLEIGTGWGELAIAAGARGARVTTLTISPAQWSKARERVAAAGLSGQVDVQLRDYREVSGRYDVVLSVEMIEAVGQRYWPAYFAAIDRVLAPGGRVGLQAITMSHNRMLATRHGHTWIHKYIFPGGQIPSLPAVADVLDRHTGLRISEDAPMGQHYAHTLAHWRARFLAARGEAARLGFGATFQRMWNLYLAYSEAGFRSGYLDVNQLLLERAGGTGQKGTGQKGTVRKGTVQKGTGRKGTVQKGAGQKGGTSAACLPAVGRPGRYFAGPPAVAGRTRLGDDRCCRSCSLRADREPGAGRAWAAPGRQVWRRANDIRWSSGCFGSGSHIKFPRRGHDRGAHPRGCGRHYAAGHLRPPLLAGAGPEGRPAAAQYPAGRRRRHRRTAGG